jgi:hypothetical protein
LGSVFIFYADSYFILNILFQYQLLVGHYHHYTQSLKIWSQLSSTWQWKKCHFKKKCCSFFSFFLFFSFTFNGKKISYNKLLSILNVYIGVCSVMHPFKFSIRCGMNFVRPVRNVKTLRTGHAQTVVERGRERCKTFRCKLCLKAY